MPVRKGEALNPAATRAKILAAASELFYAQGARSVGVNEVATAAGVSKLSIYHHFESKEALVEAFLDARSDRVIAWMEEAARAPELTPREGILALFDALGAWFTEMRFRGCALVNGAIEARGSDAQARQIAQRHLERIRALLTDLCRSAGAADARLLAEELLIAIEGATTVAAVTGDRQAATRARRVAEAILLANGV